MFAWELVVQTCRNGGNTCTLLADEEHVGISGRCYGEYALPGCAAGSVAVKKGGVGTEGGVVRRTTCFRIIHVQERDVK